MSRDELAALLLNAAPGQARPVLFLAALHELVLRRPDLPAARWYASVVGPDQVPEGDPWPDVRATVEAHQDELTGTIAVRTTQTNEVNRATYLAALLQRATDDLPDRPIALVELGASAGLLLGVDHFRIEVGSARTGPLTSPVVCRGADRGTLARVSFPPVGAAVGVDVAPVAVDDPAEVRWLEACLWPDVPDRLDRLRAAVQMIRANPPTMLRADLVDGCASAVPQALAQAPEAHVVVMTSWALTYVAPERRRQLAGVLAHLAAPGLPVSWVSAEPVGCVPAIPIVDAAPGTTVLGLRRWRSGHELPPQHLGTAHPHGSWVALAREPIE